MKGQMCVFIVLAALLVTVAPLDPLSFCPDQLARDGYLFAYSNECLQFEKRRLDWNSARQYCRNRGGDLVNIKTSEKDKFILKVLQELGWSRRVSTGVWIGATDHIKEGKWVWTIDDSQLVFGDWHAGEGPNHSGFLFSTGGIEDCAQIKLNDHGRWHDYPCRGTLYHFSFICQFNMKTHTTTGTTPTQYKPMSTTIQTAAPMSVNIISTAMPTSAKTMSTAMPTDVKTMSTAMPTDAKTMSTAMPTDAKTMSTAMPTDAKTMSTAMPTDAKTMSTAMPTDAKTMSTAVPTDVRTMSTAMPTAGKTMSTAMPTAGKTMSTAMPTAGKTMSTAMPTEVETSSSSNVSGGNTMSVTASNIKMSTPASSSLLALDDEEIDVKYEAINMKSRARKPDVHENKTTVYTIAGLSVGCAALILVIVVVKVTLRRKRIVEGQVDQRVLTVS